MAEGEQPGDARDASGQRDGSKEAEDLTCEQFRAQLDKLLHEGVEAWSELLDYPAEVYHNVERIVDAALDQLYDGLIGD